ncbi:tetratricopeptide repeat protein [Maribacter sp. SA7]|uniref:tetratricopeptide repeat-containing sensor histidine kinase n=1 Tax=Maribacter zhoushanensis TaxID=3030012 RepID=UPI0023EB1387|nr:tetratricopeptide repeat protein [Maribacter zhoushanensis]MDF4203265.1 tetratricopeptide repeat protein [Maribacter zhoushanensis]
MPVIYLSSRRLSFCAFLFLLFFSCTKDDTIRPGIEKSLLVIDSLTQRQPERSLLKLDSLLQNTKQLTTLEEATLLFNKGEALYLNDKYQEAFNTHSKCLELFVTLNDTYNESRSLITLSGASLHMGDVETSQIYALKALSLAQLIGDKRIEGKAYNQLFKLHFQLKDYDKALTYIRATDSLFAIGNDTTSIIAIKGNMASVYLKLKEYNKALTSFSEAMTLTQSQKDPKTMVSILNNIGYTYIEAGEYNSAEKFLRGSATLNKNIKAINAAPYKGLGNLYLLQSENDSAKVNYEKALQIYTANHNLKEEIEVRDKLIAISIMNGDYTTALDHQIVRDSLQLNVSTLEKDRLLNFANVNYEVKQKETEISHQKEINSRNQLLLASAVMLFVLILIATGFYIYNTKLKAANKASNLEQSLLRVQMNPHFIFNTLAAIQNITLEGNPIKSSNYIARFSKLIRQNFDYVRKESITLDKEISMIKNYIETQQLRFNNVFTYAVEVEDEIDINTIQVPPMLLQPFVENAIEYGLKEKKVGGELLLKIDKDVEGLLFVILDNGLGRSTKAKKEKLTEELHATSIFLERLKMRKKGEEKSFVIKDLYDEDNKPTGTKVYFKLKL